MGPPNSRLEWPARRRPLSAEALGQEFTMGTVKHYLLHLDESHSELTRIWALTGVCVPLDCYDDVRSAFYASISWLVNPEPNAFEPHPPELHAAELLRDLPGVDDSRRLSVFEDF